MKGAQCSVVWLFGCLVVWLFGCLVVWLFGCLVVWLFGCLVVRLFGCSVVRLFGCSAVRLPGVRRMYLNLNPPEPSVIFHKTCVYSLIFDTISLHLVIIFCRLVFLAMFATLQRELYCAFSHSQAISLNELFVLPKLVVSQAVESICDREDHVQGMIPHP